jgi:hypothetical protein
VIFRERGGRGRHALPMPRPFSGASETAGRSPDGGDGSRKSGQKDHESNLRSLESLFNHPCGGSGMTVHKTALLIDDESVAAARAVLGAEGLKETVDRRLLDAAAAVTG